MTDSQTAAAAALASLPGIGPRSLAGLLRDRSPVTAWQQVCEGRGHADPVQAARWMQFAAGVDLPAVADTYAAAGISVHVVGGNGYPAPLAVDHQRPAVLFSRGDIAIVDDGRPRVAVIGTRQCTHYGREVAQALGRDLVRAGVVVVSGLALGIDGAAHRGALDAAGAAGDTAAPVVGVVGSGLDIVYPRQHRRLWAEVGARGALLSEAPLGGAPEAWRFPARNRILAALADVVVVVESHAAGGSNHTVAAAMVRDRPVLAVPGPVTSPASAGANRLLAEGCAPVTHVDDVLVALGLQSVPQAGPGSPAADPRPVPGGTAAAALAAVDWSPTSVDTVLRRTGLAFPEVATALSRLEGDGWVRADAGWWQRLGPPQ